MIINSPDESKDKFEVEFDPERENQILKVKWVYSNSENMTIIEGDWENGIFTKHFEENDLFCYQMPTIEDLKKDEENLNKFGKRVSFGCASAVMLILAASAGIGYSFYRNFKEENTRAEGLAERFAEYEKVNGVNPPLKAHLQREFLERCAGVNGPNEMGKYVLSNILDRLKNNLPNDKNKWTQEQKDAYEWVVEAYIEKTRGPVFCSLEIKTSEELKSPAFTARRITTQNVPTKPAEQHTYGN